MMNMEKNDKTVEGIPQSSGRIGLISFITSAILLAVFLLILHKVEFQGESLLEIFTAPMLRYFCS